MNRENIVNLIFSFSNDHTAFETLESHLVGIDKNELPLMLLACGVLPEMFNHDSAEEKLWAKYSDILLSKSFELLGLKSQVIRVRGDSADVLAESSNYKIVGDAKTFRLSRTAKNQKDFKVEALDSWRRTNDYAMLVGPFCHFPKKSSAIYKQAITRNVTLLSYAHLYFMLKFYRKNNFEPLWNIGKKLQNSIRGEELKSAEKYWNQIDTTIIEIFDQSSATLEKIKQLDIELTQKLGQEGIIYWENKIKELMGLSKQEAIRRLIKSEKIEAKIDQIRKMISCKNANE
jgi:type II restriction enzyme